MSLPTKYIDLNPRYQRSGAIAFDCPNPKCRAKQTNHRLKIDAQWSWKGNFENLSTLPKVIRAKNCGYIFTIQNGIVEPAHRHGFTNDIHMETV